MKKYIMELPEIRANYAKIIKTSAPSRDCVRGHADLSGAGIRAC